MKTLEERFKIIEAHLKQRGVRDIGFSLEDMKPDTNPEDVLTEIAEVLEAEMQGKFRKVDSFKDIITIEELK